MISPRIILALALVILLSTVYVNIAKAGGPWSEQYCNLQTEHVVVKDKNGNVIKEHVVQKQVCDDGAKDFLHDGGIASNCDTFNYYINLGGKGVWKRGIACYKLDGTWEIVSGYHSN